MKRSDEEQRIDARRLAMGLKPATAEWHRRNRRVLALLKGKPPTQINVAPGSADSNDLLVLACGKCSNGREFDPFAVRLNPATLIYEPEPGFDVQAWQGEMSAKGDTRKPAMSPERVAELCRMPMTKAELLYEAWPARRRRDGIG